MENINFLKFENEKDYEQFLEYLKTHSKEESIEDLKRHKAIINCPREILGLSMKDIRNISKLISNSNYQNFLKLSNGETYEEVMIQGIVISSIKDLEYQINLLDKWVRKIDSWGLCDSVISSMKWLKKPENQKKYFEYFYNLCFEDEEFVSRFGIVTLMAYFINENYIDKIYEMCKNVKNEKYYVQMAIAWLVSVGYVYFPEKTYSLLEKKIFCKFIQNKSISKCRESFRVSKEDKEKLKQLRI